MILLEERPHLGLKIALAVVRLLRLRTWGYAPGWYESRRWRLDLRLALLALPFMILGCKSTLPPTTVKSSISNAAYPARPTVPPPPFKVFHTEPASITLVTTPNATDDQIVAIIYQLRDAARAHTFDTLHTPQKLVDARKPLIGFHVYRGPNCAAEKYAPGAPPCGASYHAAGDYTFGDYSNPNWDDGELLHGDGIQTPLWNPDAPRS